MHIMVLHCPGSVAQMKYMPRQQPQFLRDEAILQGQRKEFHAPVDHTRVPGVPPLVHLPIPHQEMRRRRVGVL